MAVDIMEAEFYCKHKSVRLQDILFAHLVCKGFLSTSFRSEEPETSLA